MKVLFEMARSNAAKEIGVVTGRALPSPYSRETLRMPASLIRDFQEYRSMAEKMNRGYDAASSDNFTLDFKGTYGSANTEMLPYKYSIRARARTLAKDTAHGRGLMRVYADNVVGDDPFELEMEVGKFKSDGSFEEEKETNQAIESAWKRFCRKENFTVRQNMDFMEAMRVVEMSRAREGSVICREYSSYPFNEFGFAVDLLEEDRLQEQFVGRSGNDGRFGAGNPIRASIEYNAVYNFPVAYWLLRRHPGEFFAQSPVLSDGKNFREQIPADQIIHFNNLRSRAEQDIGMTELDATILPLWRIHQYDKSLTLSSIASASKPWWLEQKEATGFAPPSDPATVFASGDGYIGANGTIAGADGVRADPAQTQQGGTPQNNIRPASRETLPPGYTMRQGDPKFPIEAAHEFRLDNLRDVAQATVGSYQQVTGDYQSLGFIAGLMSQQAFQRYMRTRQKSIIEDLRRLFRDWLKATINKGYFDKRGVNILMSRIEEYVDAAKFKGQQWEFVNPLVEAQTLILLCEAGHLTRQQVQDRLPSGIKFSELKTILQQEMEELQDAGLPFGQDEATEPGVNKEGDAPPGTEKSEASGTEDGGAAQPTPKSKKQPPKSRRRGEIDATTRTLIEHSMTEK